MKTEIWTTGLILIWGRNRQVTIRSQHRARRHAVFIPIMRIYRPLVLFFVVLALGTPVHAIDPECAGEWSGDTGGDLANGQTLIRGCDYTGSACESYSFSYELVDTNADDDIDIRISDGSDCTTQHTLKMM